MLLLVSVHAAGVQSSVASGAWPAWNGQKDLPLGLRAPGSKRNRSPGNVLEREEDDTRRVRLDPQPAEACPVAQVLDTETDLASEIPWRTPSPATSNALGQQGWKSWNSDESEPMLKFFDAFQKVGDRHTHNDFLREDGENSIREHDHSEESREAFFYHDRPGPADRERAGWTKMDANKTQSLQLADKMPIAIDRDSQNFIRHHTGQTRTGRSTQVRNLRSVALMSRAARLDKEKANATEARKVDRDAADADSGSNTESEDDSTEPSAALSKRGVLLRGIPLDAEEGHVLEAVHSHGEVERIMLNRAMSFAHVIFRTEEGCTNLLRSKRVAVLDEVVEVVRGPNGIGTASKAGLIPSYAGAKPRAQRDVPPGTRFVATRIVGKVDDLTFGTGMRRAKYWVQHDEVDQEAFDAGDDIHKTLAKDENSVAVYNLPRQADEATIRGWFGKCGRVKSVLLRDIVAGQSRYAIVEFVDKDGVCEAIAELDGMRRGGQVLRVKQRGLAKDEYEQMRVNEDNIAAQLGASNCQPGHAK